MKAEEYFKFKKTHTRTTILPNKSATTNTMMLYQTTLHGQYHKVNSP